MKRFLFSCLAIAFGLGIVIFSALSVGQKQVQGQANIDTLVPSPNSDIGATESAEISQEIELLASPEPTPPAEYYLPYPGILPDHALYPIKMLRDKILLSLANNPEKRFELNLLFANKRIGASKVLIFGNKPDLGIDTAIKAQAYLSKALETATRLDSDSTWYQLHHSALIHQTLIEEMLNHLEEDNQTRMLQAQENNQSILDVTQTKIPQEAFEDSTEVEIQEEVRPAEFGN